MAVLLIGLPLGGTVAAGAKETAQAEGTALTYKTGNNISAQGENGFYYAWGTPEHYVLMEYGLGWSGSDTWHGTEPYSHIAGSSLHPGDNWGVMVVWVAGGSGKVINSVIGALVMASLTNGMSLLNVNSDVQYIVKGLILIVAVWFDVRMRRAQNG